MPRDPLPPNLGMHQGTSNKRRNSRTEKLPEVQVTNFANQVSSSSANNGSTAQVKPPGTIQNGQFENVRSQLRESLAAALALASRLESKTQETSSSKETIRTGQGQLMSSSHVSVLSATPAGSTAPYATSEGPSRSTSSKPADEHNEVDTTIEDFESNDGGDPKQPNFNPGGVLGDVREQVDKTQILATNIEAALFKLFGGVNRDYKVKGRSLLFNLKDPHNPELRKQVFSEEITPERLCSMTSEELAPKKYIKWRIAKAQELTERVVLPDSDVDPRLLLKKAREGEFQDDVEHDDNVSMGVTLHTEAPTQVPLIRTNERKSLKIAKKVDSEVQNLSNLNTYPQGMQEHVVDKQNANNLPANTTFIKSLGSKRPFVSSLDQNRLNRSDGKVDSVPSNPDHVLNPISMSLEAKLQLQPGNFDSMFNNFSDGLISKINNVGVGSANLPHMPKCQPNEIDSKTEDNGAHHTEVDKTSTRFASSGGHIWEGLVELKLSSVVTLSAIFKSGEKTSTIKGWPNFLELKGTVSTKALESILQEILQLKSHALMVIHLLWKKGSPERGRKFVREAIDYYVAKGVVGYVAPVPGVGLYLCPPNWKTLRILGGFVPDERTIYLRSAADGFIGVVLRRRSHKTSSGVSARPSTSSSHDHKRHMSRTSDGQQPRQTSGLTSSQPSKPDPATPCSTVRPSSLQDKHPVSGSSAGQSTCKAQQQPPQSSRLTTSQPSGPEPAFQKAPVKESADEPPPGFGDAVNDDDSLPEPVDLHEPYVPQPVGDMYAWEQRMWELVHDFGHDGAGPSQPPTQPCNDDDGLPQWQLHNPQPGGGAASQPPRLHVGFQLQYQPMQQQPRPIFQHLSIGGSGILPRPPLHPLLHGGFQVDQSVQQQPHPVFQQLSIGGAGILPRPPLHPLLHGGLEVQPQFVQLQLRPVLQHPSIGGAGYPPPPNYLAVQVKAVQGPPGVQPRRAWWQPGAPAEVALPRPCCYVGGHHRV